MHFVADKFTRATRLHFGTVLFQRGHSRVELDLLNAQKLFVLCTTSEPCGAAAGHR
jgi:hypothetical protein